MAQKSIDIFNDVWSRVHLISFLDFIIAYRDIGLHMYHNLSYNSKGNHKKMLYHFYFYPMVKAKTEDN